MLALALQIDAHLWNVRIIEAKSWPAKEGNVGFDVAVTDEITRGQTDTYPGICRL